MIDRFRRSPQVRMDVPFDALDVRRRRRAIWAVGPDWDLDIVVASARLRSGNDTSLNLKSLV